MISPTILRQNLNLSNVETELGDFSTVVNSMLLIKRAFN